jgi:thioredoxin-dependent peroxiredoxin
MKPNPGDAAPDFTAPVVGYLSGDGAELTLSDLRGETVVLVFYPKDNTPGCTVQACALRDGWELVRERARVFGVSGDSVKSHRKFIVSQSLPYPLVSDVDHAIAQAYGVWVEKSMMGKKFMGTERSTFVIGPDGRVKAVLAKVSPAKHLDLLVEALA